MDTDSLYRRLDTIEWMMTLPPGENDFKIEAAINNCKEEGRSQKDIIQFINLAFRTEVDDFIIWLDSMNCKPIKP